MKISQVAVLDFGSQYTHLITRRIRQLGVRAEIFPSQVRARQLSGARAVILSGGPRSVFDKTAIAYDKKLFELGVPVLGLCYGHQLITQYFGGRVRPGKTKEYGFAKLRRNTESELFAGVKNNSRIWMSHGDSVVVPPQQFTVIGKTTDCPVAAMADETNRCYGLQFHPEVAHTDFGLTILKNFVFDICGCRVDWSPERYWQEIIAQVNKSIGRRKVFLLVSGGVDSTVAFAILEQILGKDRVFGLHIDTGFMRRGESAWVKRALARAGFDDLVVHAASAQFLKAISGVTDPEEKRRRIGATFLRVKDAFMRRQGMEPDQWVLGQGTIYPDTIETGATRHADTIKTHHNRVKEVLKLMKMNALVEPLAQLYKDEVRQVAKRLGLPKPLINRHPFPGPGLAIRVLCSDGRISKIGKISKLREIVGPKLPVTILPLKSVGVQGDNRTYRHPALIAGRASWKTLNQLSSRLTNELSLVNRVVYLVAPRKIDLSKITLINADVNESRLDLLRLVDQVVDREIRRHKLYDAIWQFPVVLAPLSLRGGETVILRPVESREAMTVNFYQMPSRVLDQLAKKILAVPGVDVLLYDVTNKPPGTIEWE